MRRLIPYLPLLALAVLAGTLALVWVQIVILLTSSIPTDLDIYRGTAPFVHQGAELYSVIPADHRTGFTYPPFTALLIAPLASVSIPTSFIIMTTISMAAGVRTCWLLAQWCRTSEGAFARRWVAVASVLCLLLLSSPANSTVRLGNISLVLLWLVVEDEWGRFAQASRGWLVGLATGIKLVPGLFIVRMLLGREWGRVRNACIALLLTIAIGVAVNPSASWLFWSTAGTPSSVGDTSISHNQSIHGYLMRMAPEGWTTPISVVLCGAIAVLLMLVVQRLDAAELRPEAHALTWITILLVSPVSWDHYYVFTLPALVLVLRDARESWAARVLLGAAVLALLQRPFWDVPYGGGAERLWSLSEQLWGNLYLLVAVVLAGYLVTLAVLRTGRTPTPEMTPATPATTSPGQTG